MFDLLRPDRAATAKDLTSRQIPATLLDHRASASLFQPPPALVTAINTALAVGAPLLLTGEPGTGKTQVAFYIAERFGIADRVFPLYVRSTTTASDLVYRYDAVAYFHAAHDPAQATTRPSKGRFVTPGPLWDAYAHGGAAVVLLDEIDKAPRDFPNDILNVLDQHRFFVPERGEKGEWIERPADAAPPVVVITSNSERRLPEPFLRRCIFHHLEFDRDLVERAVKARLGDFPRLDEATRSLAIARFMELRDRPLRKKPATGELLVWLAVLSARGVSAAELHGGLRDVPGLAALVKDREDLDQL